AGGGRGGRYRSGNGGGGSSPYFIPTRRAPHAALRRQLRLEWYLSLSPPDRDPEGRLPLTALPLLPPATCDAEARRHLLPSGGRTPSGAAGVQLPDPA